MPEETGVPMRRAKWEEVAEAVEQFRDTQKGPRRGFTTEEIDGHLLYTLPNGIAILELDEDTPTIPELPFRYELIEKGRVTILKRYKQHSGQ